MDTLELQFPEIAAGLRGGAILFGSETQSGLAVILSPTRDHLATVGGHGEGPGEYERAFWARPFGTNVLVGSITGTVQEFDGSGAYVRRHPVNLMLSGYLAHLHGDTVVASQPMSTRQRFGFPLHVLTLNGDTVGSFGTEDRSFNLDPSSPGSAKLYRVLTRESDTTFWALGLWNYRIQLWTSKGELLQDTVARREYVWPDADQLPRSQLADEQFPAPRVRSAHRRADGNLLTLVERRADGRRRSADDPTARETAISYSGRLGTRVQSIELVEPLSGELRGVASRAGVYLMGFIDDSTVWGIIEGKDGERFPKLYRVRFPAVP